MKQSRIPEAAAPSKDCELKGFPSRVIAYETIATVYGLLPVLVSTLARYVPALLITALKHTDTEDYRFKYHSTMRLHDRDINKYCTGNCEL